MKNWSKKNENNTITVFSKSTYHGEDVMASAVCCAEDKFDFSVGKKLADARCIVKVCKKRISANKKRLAVAKKMLEYTETICRRANRDLTDAYKRYDDAIKTLEKVESEIANNQ